jgi:hypothetical protein
MIFFGIPHKGLVVEDIQQMLAGDQRHPREQLLQQISSKSDLLTHQLADFKNLIRDRKVVSFYETEQTRQLIFVCNNPNPSHTCVDYMYKRIGRGQRSVETHRGFHHDCRCGLGSAPASRPCGGQGAAARGSLDDGQIRRAECGGVSNGT